MFASIAGRYDLLNHLLSLNIDRLWRRFTTRTVPPEPGVPVLDCCTGTADLALAYHRASGGRSPVIGADFCREMLAAGQRQGPQGGGGGTRGPDRGGRAAAPLADDTFGVVTVAFGLRNVADTVRGIDEMIRVARPGGKVAILEFSRPRGAILGGSTWPSSAASCRGSARRWPRTTSTPTQYLPASVMQFPDGQEMLDLLAARGLGDVRQHPLTFGVATLYVGVKPRRASTGGGDDVRPDATSGPTSCWR